MVVGLVYQLSLASHSDSESFLVVHALFSQDGCQREGFWEVVGHVVPPFDRSQTLPVGGGLLVPCSSPGPPVVKQLMQMVTREAGQDGRFQSVCFPKHFHLLGRISPRNIPFHYIELPEPSPCMYPGSSYLPLILFPFFSFILDPSPPAIFS